MRVEGLSVDVLDVLLGRLVVEVVVEELLGLPVVVVDVVVVGVVVHNVAGLADLSFAGHDVNESSKLQLYR